MDKLEDIKKIEKFYYEHHLLVGGGDNPQLDAFYSGKYEGITMVRRFLEDDWETIQDMKIQGIIEGDPE